MKLTLSEKPSLVSLAKAVKDAPEKQVRALLPREPRFWNVVSLRFLERQAEEAGKDLTFVAQNEAGKSLLAAARGEDLGVRGEALSSGGFLSRFVPRFALFSGGAGRRGGLWKLLAGLAVGLVVLLGAGTFALFYFSKATVTVRLNTSPLVKNKEVTLDPSVSEPDVENLVIPGIPIKVTESGSFAGEASGAKEVGSKAEGEVTVYNYDTANEKEFSEGDLLVHSDSDLKFSLSEDVTVDAAVSEVAPVGEERTITPGTTTVVLVAEGIGSQYNIDKGSDEEPTKLFFEDLDEDLWEDVYAVVKEDFSGGESKEVSVVTEDDRTKVLEEGTRELSSRCEQSLSGKLVGDQKLTGKAVESKVVEKEFTHAVGEEADKVQLNLKVECSSLAYFEDLLYRVLSEKVKDLVPEGFEQRKAEAEVEILTAEKAEEGILIQARIAAELIPQVDTAQIQADLAGRAFSELDAYFSTQPDVNSYELGFWPPVLPSILGRFPLKKEQITVKVEEM